jgi:hypothetical protein
MRRLTVILALCLLATATAFAADDGTFRVHYSVGGSGRDVTVKAESSAEARRVVMDVFPGAVVTGVRRIGK